MMGKPKTAGRRPQTAALTEARSPKGRGIRLTLAVGWLLAWLASGCNSTPVPSTPTLTTVSTIPVITSTVPVVPSPSGTVTLTSLPTHTETVTVTSLPGSTETPTPEASSTARFAVIGDFGQAGQGEADVAVLIDSWQVDFVITVGDNNYPNGSANTIDANIGQYYHAYIANYTGSYGEGSPVNRFFPSLGNHDWIAQGAAPSLDYFTLPGNERYYNFTWGPVEFFAVDSDEHEPDGFRKDSAQAAWLKERLAASVAPWKIVYFHHAAYSSGLHGSSTWMQWPFEEWGASAVLAGHDHTYERLQIGGIPYFVNGLGGGAIYYFGNILDGSLARYNSDWGAMLVQADQHKIVFQFYSRRGELIDEYTVGKKLVYLPFCGFSANPLTGFPAPGKLLEL